MAAGELRGADLHRRLRTGVFLVVILLVTACADPDSSDSVRTDYVLRPVTGGKLQLEFDADFQKRLSQDGLQLVWKAPACSWRLDRALCGAEAATDEASVNIPVVGGSIAVLPRNDLRGRLQLAGGFEIGPNGAVPLDDLTIDLTTDPPNTVLTGNTGNEDVDILFIDGFEQEVVDDSSAVEVTGIEVKLHGEVAAQILSKLGKSLRELDNVGSLTITAETQS